MTIQTRRGHEMPDVTPFVGRRSEMARVRSHLDATMAGSGRVVMIAGEPGIGKTRTAAELEHYAEKRGCHVTLGALLRGGRRAARTGRGSRLSDPMSRAPTPVVSWRRCERALLKYPASFPRCAASRPITPMSDWAKARSRPDSACSIPFRVSSSELRLTNLCSSFSTTCTGHTHHPSCSSTSSANSIVDQRILIVGTYRNEDITRGHPLIHALERPESSRPL